MMESIMTKTAIVYSPKYLEHNTGPDHPETSKRLKAIIKELRSLKQLTGTSEYKLVKPDLARLEDLELVHHQEHINLVKRICNYGGGLLDLGDTVVSSESFEVARYAVGGAIKAVDFVLSKKVENAFSLARPPGHHAGPYYAAGFCVFNNIAVAAAHLLKRFNFERILILDLDAHHGNGTQEIFYKTNKVLYISLHEDPREFPGSGFVDENGADEGLGYNVNLPFPNGTSDKPYLRAIEDIVIPIIRQYKPEFFLVSAGYDGYYGDPVARIRLSASIYPKIFSKILNLASVLSRDRFVAVLEGGYNLNWLGKLVASTISKMANLNYSIKDKKIRVSSKAEKQANDVIKEVKRVQSVFWSL